MLRFVWKPPLLTYLLEFLQFPEIKKQQDFSIFLEAKIYEKDTFSIVPYLNLDVLAPHSHYKL